MTESAKAGVRCPDCQSEFEFSVAESGGIQACPNCSSLVTLAAEVIVGADGLDRFNDPFREEFIDKKLAAGLLGMFLLGAYGSHKFYLGLNRGALLMASVSVVGIIGGMFFIWPLLLVFVMATISFVEGFIYLAKSDESFYEDYRVREQQWF